MTAGYSLKELSNYGKQLLQNRQPRSAREPVDSLDKKTRDRFQAQQRLFNQRAGVSRNGKG